IPRSAHIAGRSSLRTPSRSIRWPPVILTIGTSYFSATSAILRSCAGVVTPPLICGTTEKVPSRWMLACTRSLMNLASFSCTYSLPQIIRSSEVSPIFDLASSAPPGASAAKTADTDLSSWARMAAMSSGLASGMPGTYQLAEGSSCTSPSAGPPPIPSARGLDDPRAPTPARAAALARPGAVHDRTDAAAAVGHRTADGALRDAVAVADLRVHRHLGDPHLLRAVGEVDQQPDPLLGQR